MSGDHELDDVCTAQFAKVFRFLHAHMHDAKQSTFSQAQAGTQTHTQRDRDAHTHAHTHTDPQLQDELDDIISQIRILDRLHESRSASLMRFARHVRANLELFFRRDHEYHDLNPEDCRPNVYYPR